MSDEDKGENYNRCYRALSKLKNKYPEIASQFQEWFESEEVIK